MAVEYVLWVDRGRGWAALGRYATRADACRAADADAGPDGATWGPGFPADDPDVRWAPASGARPCAWADLYRVVRRPVGGPSPSGGAGGGR